MRIGELASATGVSVRSLRYYEAQHLIHPTRSPSGQRQYASSDVELVLLIVRLLAAGIGTTRIAELLPCLSAAPEHRTAFLLDSLRDEEWRLQGAIDAMTQIATRLRHVIDEVDHASVGDRPSDAPHQTENT